jgi:hypothetical protein
MGNLLHCHARVWSLDTSLAQVLTGLMMLKRAGKIRFTQEVLPTPPIEHSAAGHLRDVRESHMTLCLNGAIDLFLDTHDSWELDPEGLQQSTLYFKRSFDPSRVPSKFAGKVRPLGLNYEVRADGFDPHEAYREIMLRRSSVQRVRALFDYALRVGLASINCGNRPTVTLLSRRPEPVSAPSVLFMARAWDPKEIADHSPDRIQQREELNEMRARCIRALRRAFGTQFFGGLQHTPFAVNSYPDLLIPSPALSSKRRYIQLVRQYPICIATAGLHESNGWKLAEYVALSRAIVSEPLRYTVTGNFLPTQNYLEFRSPEECVSQVSLLLENSELRDSMIKRNWEYYETYLRPDMLVDRLIEQAISDPADTGSLPPT